MVTAGSRQLFSHDLAIDKRLCKLGISAMIGPLWRWIYVMIDPL